MDWLSNFLNSILSFCSDIFASEWLGIGLLALVVLPVFALLVFWQVQRQGASRVFKTYGVIATLALGVHLFYGTQATSSTDGVGEIVTSSSQSLLSSTKSQDTALLDGIQARLNKTSSSRSSTAKRIRKLKPGFFDDLFGGFNLTLETMAWFCGALILILCFLRLKPESLSFRNLLKAIGVGSRWIRPNRSGDNELGSADFASAKQLKRWLGSPAKYDTVLPVQDLRGSNGIVCKEGNLVIPVGQRNRHILIVAKTGSGKTTKMILPIVYGDCLCPHRSTIIIDSKAEMWSKCAAMTRRANPNKKLILFNPLDKMRSLSWNLLAKIENDTDCKLISNSVIMATDEANAKQDSPFFRNSALQVLNAMMTALLHDPEDRLSMPRIHELLNLGMQNLCDWLEAHPRAIRTTRSFVELARSGSQNADTIMSELSMRIQAWDLNTIRATTFFDEIDIESVIRDPSLFVVELRESELKMLRPLANVIVVELLRYMTKFAEECPGQTLPRPVGLVIDEFASALGRLPDIHIKLNTLRSRNVSVVAAIQSIGQLKGNYGEDWESVLSGFSTKIFMPSLDYTDSEWASKESGQMTVRFQTSTKGANRKITENFAHHNTGSNEQVQQRQVLTPSEVGRPADSQQTFFLPETPVFQGQLVPYYKVAKMQKFFAQFDKPEHEVMLRDGPIELEETLPEPVIKDSSDNISEEDVKKALEEIKKEKLDWAATTGDARKWWEAFEEENSERLALVLKVGHEIADRNATITDFFLAYVYSNTDNIQATLAYLDYTMHMKEKEA